MTNGNPDLARHLLHSCEGDRSVGTPLSVSVSRSRIAASSSSVSSGYLAASKDRLLQIQQQLVVILSGEYYIESTDGVSVTLKAGDMFYGGDQGAKPSRLASSKVGHLSRVVGSEPSNHVILQLKDNPAVYKIGVVCPD